MRKNKVKKILSLLIFAVIMGYLAVSMLSNGFSDIQQLTIAKYKEPIENGTVITDKQEIAMVVGILNRANYLPNIEYKLAEEPTYQFELIDRNGESEIIQIIEEFDMGIALLSSDKSGYYKISTKNADRIIELY